jgi:hypothetical protein
MYQPQFTFQKHDLVIYWIAKFKTGHEHLEDAAPATVTTNI